jgi:oligoendopeptidase F
MTLEKEALAIDLGSWENIRDHYEELAARTLSAGSERAWLRDWSALSEAVAESAAWLSIRRSQDTSDVAARDAFLTYVRDVAPHIQEAENGLQKRLVDSGWGEAGMETTIRRFESEIALFRDENLPLIAEERALTTRYGEIVGGLTVRFDGEDRTLAQLAPYRLKPDRGVREAAWRSGAEAMLGVRDDLDSLFEQLTQLRDRIATNAGFGTYTQYRWQQLARFDYTEADADRFHAAILEAAVPALERAARRRADALGVDTLRPWDQEVDPWGAEPLVPFTGGDELARRSQAVFAALDPELGAMVGTMRTEGLLDLENRKGKAPGGYCATLHKARRPFIFMNAVGTEDNVRTMLHEAGHAFHVFDRRDLAYLWQRGAPMEFSEVASMSMELLTSPYIGTEYGGFYTARDAHRSRLQHLERMLWFLPYMATVSAFQHALYESRPLTRGERDALWRGIYERYNVGADWTGLDDTLNSLWHHKLHIFTVPFYYIEYGLAQMGALQVWRNSLTDADSALRDYRAALRLGNTVTLPELFRAAGAALVFDAQSVGELIALVEQQFDSTLQAFHESA